MHDFITGTILTPGEVPRREVNPCEWTDLTVIGSEGLYSSWSDESNQQVRAGGPAMTYPVRHGGFPAFPGTVLDSC